MLESIALAGRLPRRPVSRSRTWSISRSAAASTGDSVDAAALLPHFEAVEAARGEVSLTYFEFTLLAIARLLAQTPLDLVILEVGLGGRFDAVNVFDADCAVITSIDVDHAEFLGPDRECDRAREGRHHASRPARRS